MTSDARFLATDRLQTRWDFIDLEGFLASDHRARIVVGFVESLDLAPLYDAIKSREGELRKLIERINANLKNHGFGYIPVRGINKAKAVALWHALANNLMAVHRLRTVSVKTA